MLTRNYVALIERYNAGSLDKASVSDNTQMSIATDIRGTQNDLRSKRIYEMEGIFLALKRLYPLGSTPTSASGLIGILFGSGTTTPTSQDYALENAIPLAKYTVSFPANINFLQHDNYDEYVASYVISALDDITISEVGLFLSTGGSSYGYMIDRTLIDTPITLAAGESTTITYSLRLYFGA